MAKVISFLNFKGGVGKTTTTVNVAKVFHEMGYKVLVIDADSQGNSSKLMGKKLSEGNKETLYEVMTKGVDIRDSICVDQGRKDSFDFVPSNQNLGNAEMELVTTTGREYILKEVIQPVKDYYDFILIDCAPADGLVSQNAITASDYIIVPLNGEPFAVDGMGKIIQRYKAIKSLKKKFNEDLEILGYVFTLMRKCSLHDSTKKSLIAERETHDWPGEIFRTEIKQNVCLAETAALRTNIFDYAEKFKGKSIQERSKRESSLKACEQYRELAKEILEKLNMN